MQRIQKTLKDYPTAGGTESKSPKEADSVSKSESEGRNAYDRLMDEVLDGENLRLAIEKVVGNHGAAGVDGVTVYQFAEWFESRKDVITEQVRTGTYIPKPVRRMEIPKPSGGTRNLGIPCVIDRVLQQAIAQVLVPIYEPMFSDSSFGFRPGRSTHDAIERAKSYIEEGYNVMVDVDISKFFDNMGHDLLMNMLRETITDKVLLTLIKRYLRAGIVLPDGVCIPSESGSPQGGNLSPLLSNIYLNKLDKMLDSRGHRYCRYADDLAVFVRSRRAGDRVFGSIVKFLDEKLKLKVNQEKSHVDYPSRLKYLGFRLSRRKGKALAYVHHDSLRRFRKRVVMLTKRNRGRSFESVVDELNRYLRGWANYYSFGDGKSQFEELDGWIRRRLRQYKLKLLKTFKAKMGFLKPLCPESQRLSKDIVPKSWVVDCMAASSHNRGHWSASLSPASSIGMGKEWFRREGLYFLTDSKE